MNKFKRLKVFIIDTVKQILQLVTSIAFFWMVISYPIYIAGFVVFIVIYIAFSAWRVHNFISETETIGDLSKLSNIQISKEAFSWNILSRLILLKVLNDFEKKEASKDNDFEDAKNSVSCWDVLDLHFDATLIDVKKAYKRLAKIYHPDTTALDIVDAKRKFDELTRCKNILISITKGK